MRICTIKGCNSKHRGLGFCNKHLLKHRKYGDPLFVKGHGLSKLPEYAIWVAMIQRCDNPNNKSYHNYGGRGIKVCNRWKYSFENFYDDMGAKMFAYLELDRENNNGNYEPDNCRWVSCATNIQNSSATILNIPYVIKIRDLYKSGFINGVELASIYHVALSTIYSIIHQRSWKL